MLERCLEAYMYIMYAHKTHTNIMNAQNTRTFCIYVFNTRAWRTHTSCAYMKYEYTKIMYAYDTHQIQGGEDS